MTIPVRNLLIGVIAKFALNYVLVGSPTLGALGASYATAIGWGVVAVLNLLSLFRRLGFVIKVWDGLLKPTAATVVLAVWAYYLQDTLAFFVGITGSTITAVTTGFILYFLLLMIWGAVTQKDAALIPGAAGRRLVRFLYDWGFLRK